MPFNELEPVAPANEQANHVGALVLLVDAGKAKASVDVPIVSDLHQDSDTARGCFGFVLADDILARRTPNLDVIIEHPTVVAFNA